MKLEDIGFYTLSEKRAKETSFYSPIVRAELLLTDKCNLRCPYCRSTKKGFEGEMSLPFVKYILQILGGQGLKNIRFSGGEPTLYPYLEEVVICCKKLGLEHIAISTNGTSSLDYYKNLVNLGVNDFSISLDAGCCSIGKIMTGGNKEAWNRASEVIREVSKITYVSVGSVFNKCNIDVADETIKWIDSLNPSDIRIIPSAQYNKAIKKAGCLSFNIVNKYSILKYRISNLNNNIPFRGIKKDDSDRCYIVLDDLAILKNYHFPCIIYLREHGDPISVFNEDFRKKRYEWFCSHDVKKDKICSKSCLDVCVHYNNRANHYATRNARD